MITIPPSLPIIPDAAWRNDYPDITGLTRALIDFQNYVYAKMTRVTPIDSTRWLYESDSNHPIRTWVNNDSTPVNTAQLGLFYIPESHTWARYLKFQFYVSMAHSSCEAFLYFQDMKTGYKVRATLNNGTLGGLNAWATDFLFPIEGDTTVKVWMEYSAGGSNKTFVYALCAYWEPLTTQRTGVTVPTGWETPVWRSYHTDGRADHSYVLRWLIRRGNQLVGQCPRQAVTKWWGPWEHTSGSSFTGENVGRYRFWVGPKTPSLSIALLAYGATGGSVTVKLNGSTAATITATTASYGWLTTTTLTTGLSAAAENLLEVEVNCSNGGGGTMRVASVCVWEDAPSASDLSLPGGTSIPTAFTPCHSDMTGARDNIAADITPEGYRVGRKWLVAGMTYLWGNRSARPLINDCRYRNWTAGLGDEPASDLTGDDTVQAWYKFKQGLNSRFQVRYFARNAGTSIPAGVQFVNIDPSAGSPSFDTVNIDDHGIPGITEPDYDFYQSDPLTGFTPGTQYELKMGVDAANSSDPRPLVGGVVIEEIPFSAAELEPL